MNTFTTQKKSYLWIATIVSTLALVFVRAAYVEVLWLMIGASALFFLSVGSLLYAYRDSFRGRSAAFGANAIISALLVLSIVGVLNFLVNRYPQKLDLTKNKLHTLSDQSIKTLKNLNQPLKAIYYAKINQREQIKPLLDNFKAINPKFEIEYVDPDKEPTRAKQAGIKKYGTLQLILGTKESKVDDANEEKLVNALIKLLKEKTQTACAVQGHGEKNFKSLEADGYDAIRKTLEAQSYTVKDINLAQNKISADCDAVILAGPSKALFPQEVKALEAYLADGGRLLAAIDLNLGGQEHLGELFKILEAWYVKPLNALVVDPLSRMMGVDASVPIVAIYSKSHPITKDFQATCYFPFSRPIEILKNPPSSLLIEWIAQTTEKSWGETDLASLKASKPIQPNPGTDPMGPIHVGVAINGKQKDSKASKNTRIVLFGSSSFATNQYARFGGNLDLFANAVSWLMEDESMISIRAKEEGPGKIELSQKQGIIVFLVTVIVVPLLVAIAGIAIWAYRRRL